MNQKSVLERSMDSMPPASLKTERAVLGALMVANWQERDRITAELNVADFHDPWHQWVFKALRHFRKQTTTDLLPHFQAIDRDDPAPIGGRNLQHELCLFLVRLDGTEDCGLVARLRRMAADLKALGMQRVKQSKLEEQLMRIVAESDELVRDGENDI